MTDSLKEKRQSLIDNFQNSLQPLRVLMGCSATRLATLVGLSRQTINNLESGKARMSVAQFLSLCAVVDNYISLDCDKYQSVADILDSNRSMSDSYDGSFTGFSLLRMWFLLFEENDEKDVPESERTLDDSQIRLLLRGYRVFFDETALLCEKADSFFHSLESVPAEGSEKLIVSHLSVEKIRKQAQSPNQAERAQKALQLLKWMQLKGMVQIRGEESNSNLNDTILSVFLKFRETHRLCLITQDEVFADYVHQLNGINSRSGVEVLSGYINSDGRFTLYSDGVHEFMKFKEIIPASWSEID